MNASTNTNTNEINLGLAATIALTLTRFPDAELHALNLGVEFSRLDPVNISFALALENDLIDARGNFRDLPELKAALTVVVNRRCRGVRSILR